MSCLIASSSSNYVLQQEKEKADNHDSTIGNNGGDDLCFLKPVKSSSIIRFSPPRQLRMYTTFKSECNGWLCKEDKICFRYEVNKDTRSMTLILSSIPVQMQGVPKEMLT